MFFIGVFGVEQAQKQIGTHNNVICPACGALTRFEIFKEYTYFHIFFIPTFKWNVRYYVRPACCSSIFELDSLIGHQFERGLKPEIRSEHLKSKNNYLPYRTCGSCGAKVESQYSFCPYCGRKL